MQSIREVHTNRSDGVNSKDIRLMIRDVESIFNRHNYSDEVRKPLNKEIDKYIFNCISSYPIKTKVRLVVCISENKYNKSIAQLEAVIHRHFEYKTMEMEKDLKIKFKSWRVNMLIGVLFMALCLLLSEILEPFDNINLVKLIKESFAIIGWVALWEPVSFILFGWQQIENKRLYYKKLSSTPVVVKFG